MQCHVGIRKASPDLINSWPVEEEKEKKDIREKYQHEVEVEGRANFMLLENTIPASIFVGKKGWVTED